jgi:hypothetical protein
LYTEDIQSVHLAEALHGSQQTDVDDVTNIVLYSDIRFINKQSLMQFYDSLI